MFFKNLCVLVPWTKVASALGFENADKMMQKTYELNETLAHGYSSERTQRALFKEYQHDRVKMFFNNLCVLVLWRKVASALEGLSKDLRMLTK